MKYFNWVFFLLGILYMLVLPPFLAPDESGHFATAYHYANVISGNVDKVVRSTPGNVYMDVLMREQDALMYGRISSTDEYGLYSAWAELTRMMPLSGIGNKSVAVGECRTMPYIFPLYVPAVLALLTCRLAGAGSVLTAYFARFLTFTTAWGIICASLKRYKEYKNIFVTVALFPMTLNLLSSCSADAVVIAAAFYGSAVVLEYMGGGKVITRREYFSVMAAFAVVAMSKPVYCLVFALGFLIPQGAFRKKACYYIFCMAPLFFWLWQYVPILVSCFAKGDVSFYASQGHGYSIGYVLAHPAASAMMVARSIVKELPYILAQMEGLYLGHLSMRVPSAALVLGILALAAAFLGGGAGRHVMDMKGRMWILGFFAGTYICCYCIQLLWWTPFGADVVEGVQGRYMLPFLGLCCAALKPTRVPWRKRRGHVDTAVLSLVLICLCNAYALVSICIRML